MLCASELLPCVASWLCLRGMLVGGCRVPWLSCGSAEAGRHRQQQQGGDQKAGEPGLQKGRCVLSALRGRCEVRDV